MTTLSDVLRFIQTADSIEKSAIRAAVGASFQPEYGEARYQRSAAKHERAVEAADTLKTIKVGQEVRFQYNGVNYTGTVSKINKVKAKVRITEMDAPPTKQGVVVGATVSVPASFLAQKN
jgi:hypothetical protein